MSANQLRHETSPYLLQHRDNPVHWRPWGAAALAEARTADKPILLSVGYAACHWCHVMAHESFEDEACAAVMNELYVCIKVDREERPDIDAIYQQALAMLGEQGGWPLTMFLTPAGEPYWGGTYFPASARYGRPAFADVLRGLADAYRNKKDEVRKNVAALVGALTAAAETPAGGRVPMDALDRIARRLLQEIDREHGGIGGAPKFPSVPIFELLWRAALRTADDGLAGAVTLTLDRMAQGGIYDHLGGGYARYSTDAMWLAPHFEKMLYDNAQLVELMTLVWQKTKSPLYEARIAETVDWLAREMMQAAGTFAATLDADSEGEEGRFYVWTEGEIDAVLGAESAFFKDAYDVTPGGNWEGRTILNRTKRPALGDAAHEARLADCRARLLAARARRVRPGRDDKVLADWNGLMIAALARAGFAFGRPDWIAMARDAFAGCGALLAGPGGRLLHSWCAGRAAHPATLDDHANLAKAAVTLYEIDGDPDMLDAAQALAAAADRLYWDETKGGYFFVAADAGLIARPKNAHDNAVPSGNGTMAQVLARLHLHTGNVAYRDRADATVAAFTGNLERSFFPLANLLNAAALVHRPLQVAIVGAPDDPATAALLRAVATSASLPDLVLQRVAPGQALPPDHPAAGKGIVGGKAAAYVCDGPVCSMPVTDADALAKMLAAL